MFTAWANGNNAHFHAGNFRNAFNVPPGINRQVLVFADMANGLHPTRQFFVNRFNLGQYLETGGKFVEQFAFVFIADTNL